jgi:hypothetical protein
LKFLATGFANLKNHILCDTRLFTRTSLQSAAAQNILPLRGVIIAHLAKTAGGGVVAVFRNGGFGGIHGKLLDRLNNRR